MTVPGRAPWSASDIPDLTGLRACVTGVTSGLGQVTARELARAGAQVVLASRHAGRLRATTSEMQAEVPGAALVPVQLDLADLSSVRRGAAQVAELGPLDILVNNAGVMATPGSRTVDGFELQLGTNHLGHFALTGRLFEALQAAPAARVVTVSSFLAATASTVSLADPRRRPRRYRRWGAYAQSKLANLLFALELDRRARAAGLALASLAAHPGYSRTALVANGLNRGGAPGAGGSIAHAVTALVGQAADIGALPQLRAAVDRTLPGGSYVGPAGRFGINGPPTLVAPPARAQDAVLAAGLWSLSEEVTGVRFP